MNKYKILENGTEINRIVASEEFVAEYCRAYDYTYEQIVEIEITEPDVTEPTTDEVLDILLGVNE